MKKIFILVFWVTGIWGACVSHAETPLQEDKFDSKYWLSDFVSPVTTEADRGFYVGMGLSLITLEFEHATQNQFGNSTANTQPLGASSKFGDLMGQLIPNIAYSLGMLGAYYISDDASFKSKSLYRAFFMFETSLYASITTTVLKYTVNEPRPNGSNTHSFPSGHATTIFAFAGVVGLEHEWYYGVPAYGLAAFVGFSRINDNMHFAHDIFAGGTIGASYAFGIWFNRHRSETKKSTQELFILPTDDLSGSVISWQKHF